MTVLVFNFNAVRIPVFVLYISLYLPPMIKVLLAYTIIHRSLRVVQLVWYSKAVCTGATQKKLIGHANYQPVTSELLPLMWSASLGYEDNYQEREP